MPRRHLWVAAAALPLAALALASCRPDGVRLTYRPRVGDRYTYRVEVHAEVTTTIGDTPARRTVDDDVVVARHRVLDAGPEGSRVEVRLQGRGEPARTFVVRLDRGGHLAEVQRVEGLPASALGTLGLPEIFPAAAGTPPDRLLSPGQRWRLDEPVALPGEARSRLRGDGRLVELDVVSGHDVARTASTFRLPVRRLSDETQGRLTLEGEQQVTSRATTRVSDGSVQEVVTETNGQFALTLTPRDGAGAGASVPGRVVVVVRSVTHRVG
jgi:hypothetical protein